MQLTLVASLCTGDQGMLAKKVSVHPRMRRRADQPVTPSLGRLPDRASLNILGMDPTVDADAAANAAAAKNDMSRSEAIRAALAGLGA